MFGSYSVTICLCFFSFQNFAHDRTEYYPASFINAVPVFKHQLDSVCQSHQAEIHCKDTKRYWL